MNETLEKRQSGFHYGFVIVIAIFVEYLIAAGIIFGAAGMFIVPVTTSLGIGQGQFSMYLTVQSIGSACGTMLAAKLMGKFKYRILNAVSAFTAGLGLMLMGFAQNVVLLYVGGALMGVSITFLTFLSPGTLIPRWFNQRIGTMLALVSCGLSFGGIIFNPVIAALLNSAPMFGFAESWRSAYVLLGAAVIVICGSMAIFLIRDFPEEKGLAPYGEKVVPAGETAPAAVAGVSKERAVKSPSFILLATMIVGFCLACGILQFLPAIAGMSEAGTGIVGVIGSFAMVGTVVGGFILGAINDKAGGHIGGLVAAVFGAVGLILVFVGSNSAAIMLAGAVFFGVYNAISSVQMPAMVTTLYGGKDYDRIFPTIAAVGPWASAVAYTLWGFSYDLTGSYTLMIIGGVAMCAVIAASGILAYSSSKKLREESEA